MLQQPMMYRIDHDEPGFDLAQAVRAPAPRQVAPPVPNETLSAAGQLRFVLDVCGNVLGGGLLLVFLLGLPWLLGRVFALA